MAMDKPTSFDSLACNLSSTMTELSARSKERLPLRMLLMGDFSGRNSQNALRAAKALHALRPIQVDRDTVENLPAKLGVALSLTLTEGEAPLVLHFKELDDFHPDNLFDRLSIFQQLRRTRRDLQSSTTFKSAAAEVRSWLQQHPPKVQQPSPNPVGPDGTVSAAAAGLLESVMEATVSGGRSADHGTTISDAGLRQFLSTIVTPCLAVENPQEETLVAAVDDMIAALMRAILHHPEFQALEAAWRGLYFLLSRLETDERLQVFLLDLGKHELASDLFPAADLSATATYKILVRDTLETPGGIPWTVVMGNYTFAGFSEDAELLGRMTKICARAGSPFLAGASERLVGCESVAVTPDPHDWQLALNDQEQHDWALLRALPEAAFIGLALPRFLLRLPYGEATVTIDRFFFEEKEETTAHSTYLWGNPVFACACLLGQAFSRSSWQFQPGELLDVVGLPLHVFNEQGDVRIQPCAEVLLTQKAAEQILDNGLMPLLSFKEQDRVRLARFQSIATPLTRLSGPWA